MILLLKVKQKKSFKNVFMIIRLKYFRDSLYIAVILAPAGESFTAKYAQFNIYGIKSNDGHFFSGTVIIHF